ncbi:MAG: hypothetical protein IJA78_03015 [Clostridia bacterium]|nr:hypothetical protein [Clostridia bacterium]
MKLRSISVRRAALCLGAFFFLFLLLRNASVAMDGVRQGLSLCAQTLLPSLFPFLVVSELLMAMGAGQFLERFFARPVAFLFGVSPNAAAPILLGALCGQPVASSTATAAYDRGEISRTELERISLFANNPSSGFLVGAVGEALFGDSAIGIALFLITLISATLVGIFLRIFGGSLSSEKEKKPPNGAQYGLGAAAFTQSIRRALSTFLQIAAFLLFFACISRCLTAFCEAIRLPSTVQIALLGLTELTTGICAAATTLSADIAFRFCAFFSGFAGLSVCLQIFSITEGRGVRLTPYIAAKLAQGGIALLLAEGYLFFFKPTFGNAESVLADASPSPSPILLLPCALLILAVALSRKQHPQASSVPPAR